MIFDQYQRYKTVEIIISFIKKYIEKDKLTVLEIGSNAEYNLGKMLPRDEIQYSDIELSEEMRDDKRFIQLDGCNMSEITDGQYDIVIALDVFEHIPDEKREQFMVEVNRVSGYMAIVCFPYKTIYNESAERRVNSYYKMILGTNHKWLIEHIQNGLPEMEKVRGILKRNQILYQDFYHGDIFLWEEMMKALFTVYGLQNGGYYFEEIDKLYEEQMYFSDSSDKSYRVFMMLSNNNNLLQSLRTKLNEKFCGDQSEVIRKLVLRCIDDIKYRLVSEQGRKTRIQHKVYFTFDGKFSEDNIFLLTSESLDANLFSIKQTISIDKQYKAIRFDPIEDENCIVKNLMIDSNCGELKFEFINGKAIQERIIFCNEDPQIYINLEQVEKIEWVCVYFDLIRAGFPEAIIRYPICWSMDNLIEQAEKNAFECHKSYADMKKMIMEYMQKQNEIAISLKQCNERLTAEMEKTEILNSKLAESKQREEFVKKEKSQWEEQCKYQEERSQFWEERCQKMEHTISWRITSFLRKIGKIIGK